jgi:hypothetical protein
MKTTAGVWRTTQLVSGDGKELIEKPTMPKGSIVRTAWFLEITGFRIQPLEIAGMSCFCSVLEALPIWMAVASSMTRRRSGSSSSPSIRFRIISIATHGS